MGLAGCRILLGRFGVSQKTLPGRLILMISIYTLRHSVARWLLSKNYSINFVKRFLRHRNIKMTVDLYGNFDIEDMLRIVSTGEKPVLVLK